MMLLTGPLESQLILSYQHFQIYKAFFTVFPKLLRPSWGHIYYCIKRSSEAQSGNGKNYLLPVISKNRGKKENCVSAKAKRKNCLRMIDEQMHEEHILAHKRCTQWIFPSLCIRIKVSDKFAFKPRHSLKPLSRMYTSTYKDENHFIRLSSYYPGAVWREGGIVGNVKTNFPLTLR